MSFHDAEPAGDEKARDRNEVRTQELGGGNGVTRGARVSRGAWTEVEGDKQGAVATLEGDVEEVSGGE